MTVDGPYNSKISDNNFRIIEDGELEWTTSDAGLPPGVQVKRMLFDPVMKRRTSKVRFPHGFIEPEHTHLGWHNVLVLKGRMHAYPHSSAAFVCDLTADTEVADGTRQG